ncbi:MAG TPA: hypothetical protein VK712_02895, partial [Verrucomicrobiae bacterium]|nr:hypothetical protein [Verrucomicrobiae bacterium]
RKTITYTHEQSVPLRAEQAISPPIHAAQAEESRRDNSLARADRVRRLLDGHIITRFLQEMHAQGSAPPGQYQTILPK